MLIRYYQPPEGTQGPEWTDVAKEYVFYVNDKRFELSAYSSGVRTQNLVEYQNLEKTMVNSSGYG